MMLRVNGTEIGDEAIAREALLHAGAPDPDAAARRSLAVRELLLRRAGEMGLLEGGAARDEVTFASRDDEEAIIAQVLDAEVATPRPTTEECRRHFDAHPERFTSGELVEVRHILFAVTSRTPVMALRERAEATLAELKKSPGDFAERAAEISNCPSAQHGGNLGQFGRGEMVPEFDREIFGTQATGVLPSLVATRFGFHIVLVERRIPGRALAFEDVKERVGDYLASQVEQRALQQYIQVLAGKASIEGADLHTAATPLVQ